jgi:hypothetical protein
MSSGEIGTLTKVIHLGNEEKPVTGEEDASILQLFLRREKCEARCIELTPARLSGYSLSPF